MQQFNSCDLDQQFYIWIIIIFIIIAVVGCACCVRRPIYPVCNPYPYGYRY